MGHSVVYNGSCCRRQNAWYFLSPSMI